MTVLLSCGAAGGNSTCSNGLDLYASSVLDDLPSLALLPCPGSCNGGVVSHQCQPRKLLPG